MFLYYYTHTGGCVTAEIKDLRVEIYRNEVLKGINITVPDVETHILFGTNGSGKTSLLMSIRGYTQYKITKGFITFNSIKQDSLPVDERAKAGIGFFLAVLVHKRH
jgi:Fe-S cluster assembly ATP-binding protein